MLNKVSISKEAGTHVTYSKSNNEEDLIVISLLHPIPFCSHMPPGTYNLHPIWTDRRWSVKRE